MSWYSTSRPGLDSFLVRPPDLCAARKKIGEKKFRRGKSFGEKKVSARKKKSVRKKFRREKVFGDSSTGRLSKNPVSQHQLEGEGGRDKIGTLAAEHSSQIYLMKERTRADSPEFSIPMACGAPCFGRAVRWTSLRKLFLAKHFFSPKLFSRRNFSRQHILWVTHFWRPSNANARKKPLHWDVA